MRARITLPIAVALLAVAATSASADELGSVHMPDELEVAGETLVLNGLGMREATFMKVDVYVAGLYLVEPTDDAPAIIESDDTTHLELRFVRDVDRDDITEAWLEGFQHNAGAQLESLHDRIETLNAWMTQMDEGDTLAFTYVPDHGTTVLVRGERKGVIEGHDFARALLSIWLGPEPPNRGLKQGLLGLR